MAYGYSLLTLRWEADVDHIAPTVAAYDVLAPDYAERWFGLHLGKPLARFQAHVPQGSWVLDAGCGPGRDAQSLQALGYRVLGFDRSVGMLSEGRQRGVSVPLALADLRRLPLPVRSLGGIWACASLLHLPKAGLPVALTEFARVLDSGHLYLVLKEGEGEGWQTEGRTGLHRYFARYQLSELVSLLEGSGFQVLERWLDPPGKGQRHRWISVIATVRALR